MRIKPISNSIGVVMTKYSFYDNAQNKDTSRKPTIPAFIDIKASIDSVDHAILWHGLSLNGVPQE